MSSPFDEGYAWTPQVYDFFQYQSIIVTSPSPPYTREVLVKDASLAEIRQRYPSYPEERPEQSNNMELSDDGNANDLQMSQPSTSQMVSGGMPTDFKFVTNKRKKSENVKNALTENNISKLPKTNVPSGPSIYSINRFQKLNEVNLNDKNAPPPSQSYLKPAKRVSTPKTRFIVLKKSDNINSILKQLKEDQ